MGRREDAVPVILKDAFLKKVMDGDDRAADDMHQRRHDAVVVAREILTLRNEIRQAQSVLDKGLDACTVCAKGKRPCLACTHIRAAHLMLSVATQRGQEG